MNTSYADAVRSTGEGRQSPPRLSAAAHQQFATAVVQHQSDPTGDPSTSSEARNPGAAVKVSASTASNLTTQSQELASSINPTKPGEGESLPDGYARNYAGFLIQTRKRRIHVSEDLVAAEARFLQDHLIVASFIGGRPSTTGFTKWLSQLNAIIKGGSLTFSGDMGRGFICLKASNQDAARQTLVFTPCRLGSFLCIFQQWTPAFDPSSNRGMLIPTWITLKKLPLQYFGVAHEIAASLGKVLGKDSQNCYFKDPRFCIGLDTSRGWETELEIEDRTTGKLLTILVDYANLPIRCRYCYDLSHQIRDCPQRTNNMRTAKQTATIPPSKPSNNQPADTPPQVDAEGFTTVQRKNQPSPRRPPEFSTVHDDEQPAMVDEDHIMCSPPQDAPTSPSLHQAQPTSAEISPNQLPTAPSNKVIQVSQVAGNNESSTSQVLPLLTPLNGTPPNLVDYGSSSGTHPLNGDTGGPSPREGTQHHVCLEPSQLPGLHIATQHLDEPTQPFLTLNFNLNEAAACEDHYIPSTGRANVSPSPARSSSYYRSRSRSRSPLSSSPRRNSSPSSTFRPPRDGPPGTGSYHST